MKQMNAWALTLLCVNVLVTYTKEQRVLFVSIPSLSHLNGLISIGEAIIQHHPNVNVSFALFDEHIDFVVKKLRNVHIVSLGSLATSQSGKDLRLSDGKNNLQFLGHLVFPRFLSFYKQMHAHLLATDIVNNFDLLVINMFAFAAQDLAHDLGVPFVIHSCTSVDGMFDLPSWIPRGDDARSQYDLQASFFARFDNYVLSILRMIYYLGPSMLELHRLRQEANRTTQSVLPFLNSPTQRWQNHPILIPYPLALDFRRAYTPNYHFLGFVLDTHQTETRFDEWQRIETWLNHTRYPNEFVVLVAMGSVSLLSERTWTAIVNSLDLVPNMRMLLAIHDVASRSFVSGLPAAMNSDRVLIESWIPQRRTLDHPHIRLFVNHGGLYSNGEAVYAHKPTIVLPGFGDQFASGARMQAWNVSLMLQRHTLTAETFAKAVRTLVDDRCHLAIIDRLKLLHDLSETEGGGARRAARLIDGWLRTGYTHLNVLEHDLPFWIRYQWDIGLCILCILYIVKTMIVMFLRGSRKTFEKEKKL